MARIDEFGPASVLVGGLITRGVGLHNATIAAIETDNPFAAFTLLRAYAENAAALLYAVDHPNKVERMLGLDGRPPLSVGKLTANANRHHRFGAFREVYSQLSRFAHPSSKSYVASLTDLGDMFQWSDEPAFGTDKDYVTACAWIVELTDANSDLIVEFVDSRGWPPLGSESA